MTERPMVVTAKEAGAIVAGRKTQARILIRPQPPTGHLFAGWCRVREPWRAHSTFDHLSAREVPETHVWYMADPGYKAQSRTRHASHMPRWASRIDLEIISLRAQHLQDITDDDALAEGISFEEYCNAGGCKDAPRSVFQQKWDASKPAAYSWNKNPWVWVVEFRKLPAQGAEELPRDARVPPCSGHAYQQDRDEAEAQSAGTRPGTDKIGLRVGTRGST